MAASVPSHVRKMYTTTARLSPKPESTQAAIGKKMRRPRKVGEAIVSAVVGSRKKGSVARMA